MESFGRQTPDEIMTSIFEGHKITALKEYEKARENFHDKGLNLYEAHEKAREKALEFFKQFDVKTGTSYYETGQKSLVLKIDASNSLFIESHRYKRFILITVSTLILFVMIIIIFTAFLLSKRFRINKMRNQDSSVFYVDDKAWHIERERIDQIYSIGKGHFGEVFKGLLMSEQEETGSETVAIKTMKLEKEEGMSDSEAIEMKAKMEKSFIQEAHTMSKFDSNFILKLKGFWLQDKPYMMVMEYAEHGDLRTFLLKHRIFFIAPKTIINQNYFNMQEPVEVQDASLPKLRPFHHMALEIADGMAYLENMRFVHRDLAARNCMVTSDFTVKIGDFGLSRFTDTSSYYILESQKNIPYRWMAPESLKNGKFSSKSDVFSYGILLWELVTLGESPYPVSSTNNFVDSSS
jgi:hypothetical protein